MFVSPLHLAKYSLTGESGGTEIRQESSITPTNQDSNSIPEPFTTTAGQSVRNVEYDQHSGRVIVQKIHRTTGTIINQFPSEALLKIREFFAESSDLSLTMRLDRDS